MHFFEQPTLQLARSLLGKTLIHKTDEGVTSGRIVETEAYMGPEDKGAHSFGNRKTDRTKVMYERAGLAYLFRIYGMHLCFNVVSGPPGKPEAILIRALEPVDGLRLMAKRRGMELTDEEGALPARKLANLTNGPGKLSMALGLSMDLYGNDLTTPPLWIDFTAGQPDARQIVEGPRINIDYAEEYTAVPWRFWIKDNPFVSKVARKYTAHLD
ncbi:DNA-3-methyladenine glycosylase [Bacillus marinisedimentorum]|uniref:DNA-3-methyladenine glycosylase n=1 Tax=Bacillus marinisedimentorum TaxID=1821260 RepID=UPI00087225A5|nr:DNA-3-methyladenine glycosylase [Bacillus marinisedimentorum]